MLQGAKLILGITGTEDTTGVEDTTVLEVVEVVDAVVVLTGALVDFLLTLFFDFFLDERLLDFETFVTLEFTAVFLLTFFAISYFYFFISYIRT